jgi:hypothetical protein
MIRATCDSSSNYHLPLQISRQIMTPYFSFESESALDI